MAPPQPQLALLGSTTRSPSWGPPSASPTPILVPVLASQQPDFAGTCPAPPETSSESAILNSIEQPSLSPAFRTDSPASQARDPAPRSPAPEHGRRLTDEERLIVMKICQSYSRVYLNDKPQTQFWKLIQSDFKKQTQNAHKTLQSVVDKLVKARREHIEACGTGTEPEGGDLNLALDAWILVLNEKDKIKEQRKKSSDEIEAAALASNIDRDNMKRSISEKRARDGSDDEYNDISDEEQDDIQDDDLDGSLSNAVNTPASPSLAASPSASPSITALPSARSASPQLTTSSSRSRTPAQRAKKHKKSGLNNEFKPVLDALVTSISKFGETDERATDERLSKIEAKIAEGQVELKAMSGKMLALLELIAQKQ